MSEYLFSISKAIEKAKDFDQIYRNSWLICLLTDNGEITNHVPSHPDCVSICKTVSCVIHHNHVNCHCNFSFFVLHCQSLLTSPLQRKKNLVS